MANQLRGEASLKLEGKSYLVVFGWRELAELVDEFGDKYIPIIIQACTENFNPRVMEKALAIGLRPKLDIEQIVGLNPSIPSVAKALVEALNLGITGSHGVLPEEEGRVQVENPIQ